MSTLEEAQNAMNSLNGFMVCGRKLRLNWANTHMDLKDQINAEVAVNFASNQTDRLVCEETIRTLFSFAGGEVLDVRIKQYRIDENAQHFNGLAFVHFPLSANGIYSLKHVMHQLGSICVEQ
eukprot:gene30768-38030_t